MLIWLLRKVFLVTTSGKQSSNNCEHITQWKIEMSILVILNILNKTVISLPSYYRDIINSWCKYYSCTQEVPSVVSSQFLRYNSYFKIDNKVVCYKDFIDKKINYINKFFDENGELKSWQKILSDFKLTQKSYLKWLQLIRAIPRPWTLVVLKW